VTQRAFGAHNIMYELHGIFGVLWGGFRLYWSGLIAIRTFAPGHTFNRRINQPYEHQNVTETPKLNMKMYIVHELSIRAVL
jgi:hypothetical protein